MTTLKDLLLEIFDKPWSMSHDDEMTERAKNHIQSKRDSNEEFSNIRAHKLEGDNGHLISFVRNGKLEAHHIDKNEESGEMTSHSDKPNPRFVSTMMHHLKEHG